MYTIPPPPPSWNTLSWPHKITDQIEATEEQLCQDEQKFQKKLLDDQTQLEDRLDTVQVFLGLVTLRMLVIACQQHSSLPLSSAHNKIMIIKECHFVS